MTTELALSPIESGQQMNNASLDETRPAVSADVPPLDDEMLPPEHLFSDYIEITYLGAVIIAGLALNFCVLRRLLREKRLAERGGRPKNGFVLLKLNLNISDLLILLIHATGKLGWLITYEWRGGEQLCRIFNFLSMFTLYLSSNIVICIALERLLTVLNAQKINMGQRKVNIVRLMLAVAWTLSLVFSLPQLFVWTTYNPFKHSLSQGWVQCTDIWSIDRYERFLNEQAGKSVETVRDGWTEFVLSTAVQNGYELAHLFLVFYGPLIVLLFCYALISTRLIRFAANNPCMSSQQPTSQENGPSGIISDGRQCCKRASIKSFPAVRLYAPLDRLRRKSHHQVPMIDIHEVSTRAEDSEQVSSQYDGSLRQSNEVNTPLMKAQRPSNNSLPIYGLQPDRKELSENDFTGRAILVRCSVPNGTTNGCIRSCSTHSSLSTAALQPCDAEVKPKRILVRIRDSFRDSIGRRLRPKHHHLRANLALHSSATSLNGDAIQNNGMDGLKNHKTAWWNCLSRLIGGRIWQKDVHSDHEVPQNGHYPNGRRAPSDWMNKNSTLNHSIRSSLSTTATTVGPLSERRERGEHRALPLWRRHLRSRAFRATLLVILAHVLLWCPYNVYALMKHCNEQLYERLSEQANVLKDLQFLIVLINPFLYGFGRRVQGKEQQRTPMANGLEQQRTGGF